MANSIHDIMKAPTRRVYGKVYVTYTDPLLADSIVDIAAGSEAYNSQLEQIKESYVNDGQRYFTLYDNDLTGDYSVSSEASHVGWTSNELSDEFGNFVSPQNLHVEFSSIPIVRLELYLDAAHENVARSFTVTFTKSNGTQIIYPFAYNTQSYIVIEPEQALAEIVAMDISITRTQRPNAPATILSSVTSSSFLYVGYQNESNLIGIDLLEELTYNDDVEALGGISANEITITLDNTDRLFTLSNQSSPVARQLKKNRKIEPYFGVELESGEISWHKLGVFWSYSWDVPVGSLTASVTGFDTIGLMDLTTFSNHQVQVNASLGSLIDYVLTDAKRTLGFLEWEVHHELYDIIIPYAWFEYGSHAAALRRISMSYPMHIYCDRRGHIVAAPQRLPKDSYVDIWSDDTNVIDKSYSSLYAELPNTINVTVISPTLDTDNALVSDSLVFNITDIPSRKLNFNSPCVSNAHVYVDCDSTVSYTYNVYSWGIDITFSGYGTVRSIRCTGTSLNKSTTSTVTLVDNASVVSNGVITRDVSADFIQTAELASYIANRLFSLAEHDIYDVEVDYRGDISLTINDAILLVDSLSPSNMYTIKRHQLNWNGALSGKADLNT